MSTFNHSSYCCAHGIAWEGSCISCGRASSYSAVSSSAPGLAYTPPGDVTNRDTVTLSRLVYARLMHLAYAGAQYLSIPNGQTDVEPFEATEAWLDQIDKEAGQ